MKIGGRLGDDELDDLLEGKPRDESSAPSSDQVTRELAQVCASAGEGPSAAADRWAQFAAARVGQLAIEDFATVIRALLKAGGGVLPAAQVVAQAGEHFPEETSRFAGCRSLIRDAVRRGEVQGEELEALKALGY